MRVVVNLCAVALKSHSAAFFVFDDVASELFVSASTGLRGNTESFAGLPLADSASSQVRAEDKVTRFSDLRLPPYNASAEHCQLGAGAFLGGVVRGPANEPIAVLGAMHQLPHIWTRQEVKLMEDMSFLLSQQIMSKASFQTLRIISEERKFTSM